MSTTRRNKISRGKNGIGELIRGCIGGKRFLIWFVQRKRGEITVVKRSTKDMYYTGFPLIVMCVVRAQIDMKSGPNFPLCPPLRKEEGKEWKRNGKLRKGGRVVFQRILSHWPLSRKRESPKIFSRFCPRLFSPFFSSLPWEKTLSHQATEPWFQRKCRGLLRYIFFPEQKRQER